MRNVPLSGRGVGCLMMCLFSVFLGSLCACGSLRDVPQDETTPLVKSSSDSVLEDSLSLSIRDCPSLGITSFPEPEQPSQPLDCPSLDGHGPTQPHEQTQPPTQPKTRDLTRALLVLSGVSVIQSLLLLLFHLRLKRKEKKSMASVQELTEILGTVRPLIQQIIVLLHNNSNRIDPADLNGVRDELLAFRDQLNVELTPPAPQPNP